MAEVVHYPRFRLVLCHGRGRAKRTAQVTDTTIDADSKEQARAWVQRRFAEVRRMLAPAYLDLRPVKRKSATSHIDVRGHVWTP